MELRGKLVEDEFKRFDGDILITDPCYVVKKDKPRDYSTVPNYKDYVRHGSLADYPGETIKEKMKLMMSEYEAYEKAKKRWEKEHPYKSDWHDCNFGSNFEIFGIKNYMTRDTIYGDWGCKVFNSDTEEYIGDFCADAGLVSVFLLDEVRAYNPGIDKWIAEHYWCATVIKDFHGDVHFRVYEEPYEYEGEMHIDRSVIVEGIGNINFVGFQTSL